MQIVIFEDEKVRRFLPLLHFKPVYLLYTGCRSLLQQFRFHLGSNVAFSCHLRRYLEPVFRNRLPLFYHEGSSNEDLLLVNGRLVCNAKAADVIRNTPPAPGQCLMQGDDMLFARIRAGRVTAEGTLLPDVIDTEGLAESSERVESEGFTLLRNIWDPIAFHPEQIERDAETFELGNVKGEVSPSAVLENPGNIYIGEGARIKAGAVLDAEAGFIYIGPGAVVESQAVLAENVFLDDAAVVKAGANLHRNVFIGSFSKTGGEIEDSIVEPYANKQHGGFLGHSYISSWCNLGAGTNTSDLRNDYGKVKLVLDGETVQTGRQFLGLLMGEHTMCSINSMFNSGTVAGTCSNIFGSGFSPKSISSFSWGGPEKGFEHYDIEKALETARIVMARRNVIMSAEYEKMFRHVASLEQGRKMRL
ncbi:MAG: GlmU family protein [Chlorobiales bacterium]|nr:GlmU family protein [Chlorobiales bacterium]